MRDPEHLSGVTVSKSMCYYWGSQCFLAIKIRHWNAATRACHRMRLPSWAALQSTRARHRAVLSSLQPTYENRLHPNSFGAGALMTSTAQFIHRCCACWLDGTGLHKRIPKNPFSFRLEGFLTWNMNWTKPNSSRRLFLDKLDKTSSRSRSMLRRANASTHLERSADPRCISLKSIAPKKNIPESLFMQTIFSFATMLYENSGKYLSQTAMLRRAYQRVETFKYLPFREKHTHGNEQVLWRPTGTQTRANAWWQRVNQKILSVFWHFRPSSLKLRPRNEPLRTPDGQRIALRFVEKTHCNRTRCYQSAATVWFALSRCSWDKLHAAPSYVNRGSPALTFLWPIATKNVALFDAHINGYGRSILGIS